MGEVYLGRSSRSYGEKCGVNGFYNVEDAAVVTCASLANIQHRGEFRAGIASSDGSQIYGYSERGLVNQVFDGFDFRQLPGMIAIGHTQYPTHKKSASADHPQPVRDELLALAHNGNLASTKRLQEDLEFRKIPYDQLNDSEMMHAALSSRLKAGASVEDAIKDAWGLFTGVFSVTMMTKDKLVAIRDMHGIRPLSMARVNGGFGFASEDSALHPFGPKMVEDVLPGQMVVIDRNGPTKEQIEPGDQKLDLFEFVYFSRHTSTLLGQLVSEVRKRFGKELAKEIMAKGGVDYDVVCPVPNSGIYAAIGCAEELGIPYAMGLEKNERIGDTVIGRTFLESNPLLRKNLAFMKYRPVREVLEDKRVLLVDDSVFRGTTTPVVVSLAQGRREGEGYAKSVDFASASSEVRWPNYYGIDTPNQHDLIAAVMTQAQILEHSGARKFFYISQDAMVRATGLPKSMLSKSDFDGEYPSPIHERASEIFEPIAA